MNNPLRAASQRWFEAPRLLEMGGPMGGGRALEIGCGNGNGTSLILEQFGADHVDAFDLDADMVRKARRRLHHLGARTRVWQGDAEWIAAADKTYDAVIDFGIIHHIPRWRRALDEVARVLKPGGRFYAEEVLAHFLLHPLSQALFLHPEEDRFDDTEFVEGLERAGLTVVASRTIGSQFGWFVADKPAGASR